MSEMLSGEHLLQKIDYGSKEQSQKRHISLHPLGAELCHVWDPYMLTNMGSVTGSPSPMGQTQCCSHHPPALCWISLLPPQDWPSQGTNSSFVPKCNGLKTLHVQARSLLFFMGVKETL